MSGLYIKNMKMPKRCLDCNLCRDRIYCDALVVDLLAKEESIVGFDRYHDRLPNCPLVLVETREDALKILEDVGKMEEEE